MSVAGGAGANRADRIRSCLEAQFAPLVLELRDESRRHAGHAGVAEVGGAGETHYVLLMVSAAFASMSRVERSRRVHEALDAEFRSGLHALSLTLRTPEEHAARG